MIINELKSSLLVGLLVMGTAIGVAAQTPQPVAAPVALVSSAPAGDGGEADFFNNGQTEVAGKPVDYGYQENFVKQSPIQFGGYFRLKLKTGIDYYRDWSAWTSDYLLNIATVEIPASPGRRVTDKVEDSSIDLQGSLFFSARPTSGLRLFGKTQITYPFSTAATGIVKSLSGANAATAQDLVVTSYAPNIKIWELFADFNINETVFFRAGKQMVKWGAGPFAFWSPADVISLGTIDINNRGQDLEGPFAIKANLPFGDNNLDFYVTTPGNAGIASVTDLAYAARVKILVGGWELGTGVVNSKAQDLKLVATASGSLWHFNLWAEALVSRQSTNFYLKDDATNPSGYSIGSPRSDWFLSGTAGLSYANADIYLDTVMVQYYFNRAGGSDMDTAASQVRRYLAFNPADFPKVLGAAADWTGMHYLAITAQESFVHDSKTHLSATWLANLSDGSGFVSPGVSFDITDEIKLGLTTTFNYGPSDSQFMGIAGIAILNRPRWNIGLNLSLGTGNF